MNAAILGAGLWAQGQTSFDALARAEPADPAATQAVPRPAMIAPRELRRLPTPARLAIEVASQACTFGRCGLDTVTPVFTSAIGDADITDYMCRVLSGKDKLLSPIRFQNSVHNAPAGCLSIAAANMRPSSFVSSFEKSLALALFESLTLVQVHADPVLLVTTDVPIIGPLADVHGPGELAACALLLVSPDHVAHALGTLSASIVASSRPPRVSTPQRSERTADNATLQAWPLLVAMAAGVDWHDDLVLGNDTALSIELRPAARHDYR